MKKRVLFLVVFIVSFLFFIIIFSYMTDYIKTGYTITGKASSTATISFFVLGDMQQRNMVQGWNFVSFNVKSTNYSVESVLSSIDGYYDYVLEWDSDRQEFKTWSRFGSKDFTELNENKSYFIFMNDNNKQILLNGERFGNLTLILKDGWETPNYIYEYDSENITGNYFKNVTFDYIQKWNETNQEFMVYSKLAEQQPFNKIYVGEGYFILTRGGNLVYIRTQ